MALSITNQIAGCSTTRHKDRQQRIGEIEDEVHIMLQNVSNSQMGFSLLHTAASSKPMLSLSVGMVSLLGYQTVYFLCWSIPVYLSYLYLGHNFSIYKLKLADT